MCLVFVCSTCSCVEVEVYVWRYIWGINRYIQLVPLKPQAHESIGWTLWTQCFNKNEKCFVICMYDRHKPENVPGATEKNETWFSRISPPEEDFLRDFIKIPVRREKESIMMWKLNRLSTDLKQQKRRRCLLGSDDNCKMRLAGSFKCQKDSSRFVSYIRNNALFCVKVFFLCFFFFFFKKAAQKKKKSLCSPKWVGVAEHSRAQHSGLFTSTYTLGLADTELCTEQGHCSWKKARRRRPVICKTIGGSFPCPPSQN